MRLHQAVLLGLFSVFQCSYLQGCAAPDTLLHTPPLATNVPKIVKGQTTKDEVLKYFGIPDIEADGAQVKINPDMALIRMYRVYHTPMSSPKRERLEFEDHIGQRIKSSFPYSSIDDKHTAFVYIEYRYGWGGAPGLMITKQYFNRLLIFIDKKTNVVDEFFFREEIDCTGAFNWCHIAQ